MSELKKIVVIGPVYPYKGGISHYTGMFVNSLKKAGFDVTTVSYKMRYPKFMFKKEQKDYSNKTFEIADANVWLHTANPINIIGTALKIKKLKPDMVILQWWHPYFAPCYQLLLSALGKKIKVLFVCHNVLPHERFPMDKFLAKGTLKKGNYCIVQSKEDESNLIKLIPDMSYIRSVHPTYSAFMLRGIDRKTAREELGIKDNEKMLLFFGFVRKYKGLQYLLEALPDIAKANPDAKVWVVGEFAGDKEDYLDIVRKNNMLDKVEIRDGYIPDTEVEPYFAAADLCICPYESATQSGIVQIAYGFELPVIVTNVGGLPEVVTDGKTGYVVESENPGELAKAVNKYFDNNCQDEFRENVRLEKERFSWDRVPENVLKLWKSE